MQTLLLSGLLVLACASAPRAGEVEPSALGPDAPNAKTALSSCATQRASIERSMASALDASATEPDVTTSPDFSLALVAADGHQFVYTHGDSSLDTPYESASTSKWVAAAVILDLVDRQVLRLDSDPAEW